MFKKQIQELTVKLNTNNITDKKRSALNEEYINPKRGHKVSRSVHIRPSSMR